MYENLAFGLRMRKVPKAEQQQRVEEIARVLGLSDMLQRRPAQLSGGQRQRVAMGRAIVREPKAFLMDEPLSNLDAKLRVQMRAEIARIQQALKVTTLYVTHDQVEAMTMGHRVAVMRDGVLQQVDTPQRLYDAPDEPLRRELRRLAADEPDGSGVSSSDGDLHLCEIGETTSSCRPTSLPSGLRCAKLAGRRVAVGIRPEDVREASGWDGARLRGRILLVESLGAEQLVHIEITAQPLERSDLIDADRAAPQAPPWVSKTLERTVTLLGRFDRHLLLAPGEAVEVAIDPRLLHFFDLETGVAIPTVGSPGRDRGRGRGVVVAGSGRLGVEAALVDGELLPGDVEVVDGRIAARRAERHDRERDRSARVRRPAGERVRRRRLLLGRRRGLPSRRRSLAASAA